MAINDHFSAANGFRYTTATRAGTTGSLLMDFLTNKEGYCEQYASAMAFLVRAAGIPARVAVGFGYGRDTDDYISVTNKDAHAWVEVYFSGHGWVPFDPTPPSGTGGRTGGLDWTAPDITPGSGAPLPGAPAPTNTPNPQQSTPADEQDRGDQGLALPSERKKPTRIDVPSWFPPLISLAFDGRTLPQIHAAVWWLLGLLGALLVGAIPGLTRLRLRHRRMSAARSPDPVVAAHAAWDELVDVLADLGMPIAESETPRVTARRLGEAGLVNADRHAIDLLAAEEERARYAPRTGRPGPSRRAEATQRILAVQVVGRSLADRASLQVRLKARFLPPSLLRRTSESLAQVSEDISVGIRDVQAALKRRLLTR
jgi:hypothetical protein